METVSKRRLFRDAILNVLQSVILLKFFFAKSGLYLNQNIDRFRDLSSDDSNKDALGSVYITLAFVAIGGEFNSEFSFFYFAKSHEVWSDYLCTNLVRALT